jgi:HSP20 family protein
MAGMRRGFRPAVDCFRRGDPATLTVVADLAGVDPDSIEVVVADRTLVIAGERVRPKAKGRVSYQQMEIEYGPFQRQLLLGDDVDVDAAEATYECGILTVTLPVAPRPAGSDRISIEVHGAGS